MFLGYAVEQATANLQMHEPMIKQYQSLEKNNARLTEQLAESQESAQQCLASLTHPEAASEPVVAAKNVLSHYDPEKKMMVIGSLKDNK
jgi:spore germination cell wall hydrolase CwlJ-like protein